MIAHLAKAHRKRALQVAGQIEKECNMSYLDTPEHKVGSAAFGLRQLVTDLWEMRLRPETADLVIQEEFSLKAAFQSLSALVEDVRVAKENVRIAAE